MNIGFGMCGILFVLFAFIGLLFAVYKEKAAKFVSGFNSLSQDEQVLYDKAGISRDMRNQCFVWSAIMFVGAMLSFITPYMAVLVYVIWIILFCKEVHFDAHKAFEKYLLK